MLVCVCVCGCGCVRGWVCAWVGGCAWVGVFVGVATLSMAAVMMTGGGTH